MQLEEIVWTACLFDGEGSFSLTKGDCTKATRPAKRGFHWIPNAHVINTSLPLLERAHEITKMGRLGPHGSDSYRPNNKPLFDWTLRREEIKELLPLIIPHLIVKREQAELLLEAVEMFEVCKGLGPNPVTPIRDHRLETVFWRMRYLNAKTREGPQKVLEEEKVAGHVPYSRAQWLADSTRVRDQQDRINSDTHRHLSREWKRRNKKKAAEYWANWAKNNLGDPVKRFEYKVSQVGKENVVCFSCSRHSPRVEGNKYVPCDHRKKFSFSTAGDRPCRFASA